MSANARFKSIAGRQVASAKQSGTRPKMPRQRGGMTMGPKKQGTGTGGSGWSPNTNSIQVGGQTVQVRPGQTHTPGSAGVHTPTIQPFQTPTDMMQMADEDFNLEKGLYDLDAAFAKLKTDTDYQKTAIDKSEKEAKNSTVDDMIARGLYSSSIKDGEIYDIQATASLRRNFLDTTLKSAEIETGTQKTALSHRAEGIRQAMERKMVENAQDANEGAPDWQTPPTPGTTGVTPKASIGPKPIGGKASATKGKPGLTMGPKKPAAQGSWATPKPVKQKPIKLKR